MQLDITSRFAIGKKLSLSISLIHVSFLFFTTKISFVQLSSSLTDHG